MRLYYYDGCSTGYIDFMCQPIYLTPLYFLCFYGKLKILKGFGRPAMYNTFGLGIFWNVDVEVFPLPFRINLCGVYAWGFANEI